MELKEQLKKSDLFPEQIKFFILESLENNKLTPEILHELEIMLAEERKALEDITKKYL